MTRAGRLGAIVRVALAGAASVPAAAAAAPTDGLTASPAVRVIHVATPSGATGTVRLANPTPEAIQIQSITPQAGCASAVTIAPVTPFTLAANDHHDVTLQCASDLPAGMHRCVFDVRGADGPLLQLEGVCARGDVPGLVATTPTLDLGAVTIGTGASSTIVLENTSQRTLTRIGFHTTDLEGTFEIGAPCTLDARACDAPAGALGPADTLPLEVWCRPKSPGPRSAELYIASDAGVYLAGPIALACEGTPASTPVLAVTGTPILGGAIDIAHGELAERLLRVRNAGAGSLKLTNATIASGAPDWSYTARGACAAHASTGALEPGCELAPGDEVTLALAFAPQQLGLRAGALLLDYVDTAARQLVIPLTGHGLGGTLVPVGAASQLDFGLVPLAATSQLSFSLGNTGNLALTDVTVELAPSGPPFSATGAGGLTVEPGSDTRVTATCAPTAPGLATAVLQASSPTISPVAALELAVVCEGSAQALHAAPSSIALGEVRTMATLAPLQIEVRGTEPLIITDVELETPSPQLTLTGPASGPTPLTLELAVTPQQDQALDNAILVRASNGDALRIPIAGHVVTPAVEAPPAHSLGTFCVGQPTTPGTVALRAAGSGALRVMEPAMLGAASSPFVIEPVAPTAFPALLRPDDRAVIQVTPRRRSAPEIVQDELLWATDVEAAPAVRTAVSATFVSDGGAIAPTSLDFGKVPAHGRSEPQTITLQNCDRTPIRLEAPELRAPFTLERGSFPIHLEPNEIETIAVGFHPAQAGRFAHTMTIPSLQLVEPLEVALTGEGVRSGGEAPEIVGEDDDERSFYGCAGCAAQDPGGVLAALGVTLVVVLGARRRRR